MTVVDLILLSHIKIFNIKRISESINVMSSTKVFERKAMVDMAGNNSDPLFSREVLPSKVKVRSMDFGRVLLR